MEGYGGGLVIALRRDGGFRGPDREALNAFATSVSQRLAAERSVEITRLRYGMEARERERTRWAREIHDEAIQGLAALLDHHQQRACVNQRQAAVGHQPQQPQL